MQPKRTSIDFSNHVHTVKKYYHGDEHIRVDSFKRPGSSVYKVQFLNNDNTLTVSGDLGNWVFCRPFIPHANGGVSDRYWIEKLKINSIQKFEELDLDGIAEDIREMLDGGLEEYGYDDVKLSILEEWLKCLLNHIDSGNDYVYIYHAYFSYDVPRFIDHDFLPHYKKENIQLNGVFDAFDEMCRRIKEGNLPEEIKP